MHMTGSSCYGAKAKKDREVPFNMVGSSASTLHHERDAAPQEAFWVHLAVTDDLHLAGGQAHAKI
jgi:hypothetical protein